MNQQSFQFAGRRGVNHSKGLSETKRQKDRLSESFELTIFGVMLANERHKQGIMPASELNQELDRLTKQGLEQLRKEGADGW